MKQYFIQTLQKAEEFSLHFSKIEQGVSMGKWETTRIDCKNPTVVNFLKLSSINECQKLFEDPVVFFVPMNGQYPVDLILWDKESRSIYGIQITASKSISNHDSNAQLFMKSTEVNKWKQSFEKKDKIQLKFAWIGTNGIVSERMNGCFLCLAQELSPVVWPLMEYLS